MNAPAIRPDPYRTHMLGGRLANYLPGLMVGSVPFAGWSLLNIGSTFSFTASYVIGLAALVLNLPRLLELGALSRNRHFLWLYGPLVGACLVSALPLLFWEYRDAGQYAASLAHLCFFIAITYCLLHVGDVTKALDFFASAYTFTAVLVAVIGLYDFALVLLTGSNLGITFNTVVRQTPSTTSLGLLPRASSVFFEPGWFAHYLLIDMIVVATWLLPRARAAGRGGRVWVLRSALLVMLLALLATLSASAYLVLGVVVVFSVLSRPRPLRSLGAVAAMLAVLALIPLPNDLPNPLAATFERFAGLATDAPVAGESADSRGEEFDVALTMLKSTIMLGGGYGQSARFIQNVAQTGTLGISSFYGILLAETGLLGFFAFGASILALNYKLWHLHRRLADSDASRVRIVFCCRCVILAETVFLNFFSSMASATYVGSFWLALVVLIAWARMPEADRTGPRRTAARAGPRRSGIPHTARAE